MVLHPEDPDLPVQIPVLPMLANADEGLENDLRDLQRKTVQKSEIIL